MTKDQQARPARPATVFVEFTVQIRLETLQDLLSTAVEQGCPYWAEFDEVQTNRDTNAPVQSCGWYYTSVRVAEREPSKGAARKRFVVTPRRMVEGLEKLARADHEKFPAAGKHLADALTGDWDAVTADVVLQMATFGELVYG
jgi:hypothetical protein